MRLNTCVKANQLREHHPEQLAEHRAECSICLADTIWLAEQVAAGKPAGNLGEWYAGGRPLLDVVHEMAGIPVEIPKVVKQEEVNCG